MFMKLLCNPSTACTVGPRRQLSAQRRSTAMAVPSATAIIPQGEKLSHQVVAELSSSILANQHDRTVVVDMRNVEDASTAAFAKLVLLRRELLSHGRDLRLRGMRSRVASMWRISRLAAVLPVQ